MLEKKKYEIKTKQKLHKRITHLRTTKKKRGKKGEKKEEKPSCLTKKFYSQSQSQKVMGKKEIFIPTA